MSYDILILIFTLLPWFVYLAVGFVAASFVICTQKPEDLNKTTEGTGMYVLMAILGSVVIVGVVFFAFSRFTPGLSINWVSHYIQTVLQFALYFLSYGFWLLVLSRIVNRK